LSVRLALNHEKANVMSAVQQDPGCRKDRSVEPADVAQRSASPVFIVSNRSEAAAVQSPARTLQRRLSGSFGANSTERWSGRTTLLFIIAVCGGFWLALYLALALLWR